MELTLVTVAASICMGLGAVFLFVAAVKRNWFRNIEDAKYQVFWADLEDLVDGKKETGNGEQSKAK